MDSLFTFFSKPLPVIKGVAAVLFAVLGVACIEAPDVDDFGLGISFAMRIDSEDIAVLETSAYAKPMVPCRLWINDEEYRAQVFHSGATSVDDYKKNFELELDRPYDGLKIFRLNAMPEDPSAMRALLTHYIFSKSGFPMPRLEPVPVWVNEEYAGLYLFQQKIDAAFWRQQNEHPISVYQGEDAIAMLDSVADMELAYSVKTGSKEFADLKRLIELVNIPYNPSVKAQLEKILNVEQVLQYTAIVNYTKYTDGIRNNYFLARTQKKSRFRLLPWDMEATFHGTANLLNPVLMSRNKLMSRLIYDDPDFYALYLEIFDRLLQDASPRVLSAFLDDTSAAIADAWNADPSLANGSTSLENHVSALKSKITKNYDSCHAALSNAE